MSEASLPENAFDELPNPEKDGGFLQSVQNFFWRKEEQQSHPA